MGLMRKRKSRTLSAFLPLFKEGGLDRRILQMLPCFPMSLLRKTITTHRISTTTIMTTCSSVVSKTSLSAIVLLWSSKFLRTMKVRLDLLSKPLDAKEATSLNPRPTVNLSKSAPSQPLQPDRDHQVSQVSTSSFNHSSTAPTQTTTSRLLPHVWLRSQKCKRTTTQQPLGSKQKKLHVATDKKELSTLFQISNPSSASVTPKTFDPKRPSPTATTTVSAVKNIQKKPIRVVIKTAGRESTVHSLEFPVYSNIDRF